MTIPVSAVHMDDKPTLTAAVDYARRTWIPGSHAAFRCVLDHGRRVWQVWTWRVTS